MDQMHALIQTKHDEGLSAAKNLIERMGEDSFISYISPLITAMQNEDDNIAVPASLGILGAMYALLSLREDLDSRIKESE